MNQGKLNRVLRVIERANELCPAEQPTTASTLANVTAQLIAPGDGVAIIQGAIERKKAGADANVQQAFDRGIALLEKATGSKLELAVHRGFNEAITAVAWARTGPIAVANGKHVSVLESETELREMRRLDGYTQNVTWLAFTADGKRLASSSSAETLVWDVESAQIVYRNEVASLAISPEGDRMTDGENVWSVPGGAAISSLSEQLNKIPPPKRESEAPFGAWFAASPDLKRVATAADGIARVWDLATGKITRIGIIPSPGMGAAFSADGRRLAVTFEAGVRVWDIATHKLLLDNAVQDQPYYPVRAFGPVAFSPNGESVVYVRENFWQSGESSRSTKLVKLGTRGYGGGPHVNCSQHEVVAFSPDGKRLVSGGDRSAVFGDCPPVLVVWDANTGQPTNFDWRTLVRESQLISPSRDSIAVVARTFDPDKRWIYLWNAAGQLLQLPGAGPIEFSQDGKQLAFSAGSPAPARIIVDTATGREVTRKPLGAKAFASPAPAAGKQGTSLDANLEVVLGNSGWVMTNDKSAIEVVGDAARSLVTCRIGPFSFPFTVCEERFSVHGLMGKLLASDVSYKEP